MALTQKQTERLGRLLMAGVPLPIALPIAMDEDPVGSATIATQGVTQLFEEAESKIASTVQKAAKRKVSKKARTSRKNLSAALKEANKKLRTKSGALRKGKTQRDIMRLAQKLKKKM